MEWTEKNDIFLSFPLFTRGEATARGAIEVVVDLKFEIRVDI